MVKLTPWFNAKFHSPSREGWYDCKECNARHYFKDGLWYRNKKSLRSGSMTINKMHWRGLIRESLESLLSRFDPNVPMSAEERAWENMAPVGMEFGSPDYEKLMRKSMDELKEGTQSRDQLFNSSAPDSVNADQVFQYANALFLSDDKAWHWLGRHCPALAARPIDLLSTPAGCGRVMQVLFAKYHSVYL